VWKLQVDIRLHLCTQKIIKHWKRLADELVESLWSNYSIHFLPSANQAEFLIVPVVVVDKKTLRKISKILYSYSFYDKKRAK